MSASVSPESPSPSPSKRKSHRLPPALLGREDAASFLSLSVSKLDRMNAGGELPAPRKLSGRLAWSRRELLLWVDHDCPDRKAWSAIWKQLRDRRPRR
jgi:predicted DNA-binding transcriptional regulator AlpA